MPYSTHLYLTLATLPLSPLPAAGDGAGAGPAAPELPDVVAPALQRLWDLVADFRRQSVTPARARQFEQQPQQAPRELGRGIAQHTYNHPGPGVPALAKHARFAAAPYARLNAKTPQNAWTLFGQVRLWRVGYRPTDKDGDPTPFPLALAPGLVRGASPALAGRAARLLAGAGMTRKQVLRRLRQDHGVGWGVKKLRQVTAAVSQALTEQRHDAQARQLLAWPGQASAGTGRHKPVLSAGRGGITPGVRIEGGSVFEVATAGTVSVPDRRGQRPGTAYLAYAPESCQGTMSRELTRLLREVLRRREGPAPRLCYVTDAGDNETAYYDEVLSRMKHPRTGTGLDRTRVADYYRAGERVRAPAELPFGKGRRATGRARKMQRWLLKPGGVNRVLHSAAAFRDQYGLKGRKRAEFRRAYRYLRDRMKYVNYAEYRRLGVPLGSGVTEAGCKAVYAQRLKLSGMRWRKAGAQTVLNLRVLLLSGAWDEAQARVLAGFEEASVGGQAAFQDSEADKAA